MRVLPYVLGGGRGQGQEHALPEVSVKGGQGEAKGYSKSGTKEAKGGEEMTREDVVQAALTVERWCAEHKGCGDCPLLNDEENCMVSMEAPDYWNLEEQLRTRGLKNVSV